MSFAPPLPVDIVPSKRERETDEDDRHPALHRHDPSSIEGPLGGVLARTFVLIIAWFDLLSLFLNGCRVPLEATDKIGSKKSPLE